jgi:hypothetical protein
MRCLYCNKKLSLLKLAKGDSFCSAQHFDAYQLQQSKDAFERLMSQPDEDAPRAPLVVQQREEEHASVSDGQEESAALARLTAFAPPAPPAPEAAVLKAPPYAPFAISLLPACPLNPASPITNEPEGVEAARELAYPVHEVAGTVCILNLYLRLSLAETEPKDWTPARFVMVTPEDFRVAIQQPPIGLVPEFGQIEDLAPADAAAPIEAVPLIEAAPLVEAEIAPSMKPMMPEESSSVTPVESAETEVPFLEAPSFRPRTGKPILVHGAASSVPTGSSLAPILEQGDLARPDSCRVIPKSTRVVGNTAFHSQDSAGQRIKGASEFPIQPAFVLPDSQRQVCEPAWLPSDHRMAIARPALEASWESTRALDFDLPAPGSLMVHPDASRLGQIDPQQLLAGTGPLDTASLFLGVLETRPLGQEPLFIDPPACAMESGWPATLAQFPSRTALPAAWQPRSSHFPLPDPIAAGSESPLAPLESFAYAPACSKMERVEKVKLPAPYIQNDGYRLTEWTGADSASTPLAAHPGLVFIGSTVLPHAAAVPPGSLKRGSGDPMLKWEPCRAVPVAPTVVKFLPVRDGAILPQAKSWTRLDGVPR